MARARNIKPGFYKNEDLAECSVWARYIYPGLWMLADREGRLEDRPKRIKGELIPFDAQDVEPLLQELAAKLDAKGQPFIQRYVVNGVRYIQIVRFKEHQSPHYSENQSVIPPPSLPERCADDGGSTPGNARPSLQTPQEQSAKSSGDVSGSPPPIKAGAQPPDSLIPDSLIPELPPYTPRAGGDTAPDGAVVVVPAGDLLGDKRQDGEPKDRDQRTCDVVLDAYHAALPLCVRISVLNPKRRKRILAAHKLAAQLIRRQGWSYTAEEFWAAYFEECQDDPWLRGEVPNPKNPRWKQNLDVLIDEDRFASIMDKAIAAMAPASRSGTSNGQQAAGGAHAHA